MLSAVAAANQLIGLFGILLLLIFLEALSLEQLPVYLHQHAAEGSALGMFECQHAALSGSRGHHSYYLGSIGIRKVSVELALHNRTHHSHQMLCLCRNGDYMGTQPAEIL